MFLKRCTKKIYGMSLKRCIKVFFWYRSSATNQPIDLSVFSYIQGPSVNRQEWVQQCDLPYPWLKNLSYFLLLWLICLYVGFRQRGRVMNCRLLPFVHVLVHVVCSDHFVFLVNFLFNILRWVSVISMPCYRLQCVLMIIVIYCIPTIFKYVLISNFLTYHISWHQRLFFTEIFCTSFSPQVTFVIGMS